MIWKQYSWSVGEFSPTLVLAEINIFCVQSTHDIFVMCIYDVGNPFRIYWSSAMYWSNVYAVEMLKR